MSDPTKPRSAARRRGTTELEAPAAEGNTTLSDPGPGDTTGLITSEGVKGEVTGIAGGDVSLRQASLWGDAWRQLRTRPLFLVPLAVMLVLIVMAAFPGLFTSTDPRSCDLNNSLGRPSGENWFGYDIQGCDYYSRVIFGARVSVLIGFIVVVISATVGVTLGAIAGFYGRWIDILIARITDVWFAVPTVLGAIVILNMFSDRKLWHVMLALVILGWPTFLRLVRSSVLSVREQDYVAAARALGASNSRIIIRHILPNSLAPVIVYGTIAVGGIIAAEATLSFLGVGLQLPAISWGLMISDSQRLILQAPHLLLFPGLFLSLTVLSFILMGDALRDALDPKLR